MFINNNNKINIITQTGTRCKWHRIYSTQAEYKKNNSIFTNFYWRESQLYYFLKNHLITYPTSKFLSFYWGMGSIAGVFLIIQIVTGLILSMYFCANSLFAFDSVEYTMRDVSFGWLFRYMHSNGASFFFLIVYLHIARGLFYKSFMSVKLGVWITGMIIYVLMMATAFIGYVLPWGQMSFWGATVITNLFSVIPVYGNDIAQTIWGGFSVENPTLNRFFAWHFVLPFVILGFIILHLVILHQEGSSLPVFGNSTDVGNEKTFFYPYFFIKDLVGFLSYFFMYLVFVFFYPNALGHPDNYIPANPLVTPLHIVPEWYFLPFYAILRSFADKVFGVLLMAFSLLFLFCLPLLFKVFFSFFFFFKKLMVGFITPKKVDKKVKFFINFIEPFYHFFYWKNNYSVRYLNSIFSNTKMDNYYMNSILAFFLNFILLGYIGFQEINSVYIIFGQICSFLFFFIFINFWLKGVCLYRPKYWIWYTNYIVRLLFFISVFFIIFF